MGKGERFLIDSHGVALGSGGWSNSSIQVGWSRDEGQEGRSLVAVLMYSDKVGPGPGNGKESYRIELWETNVKE